MSFMGGVHPLPFPSKNEIGGGKEGDNVAKENTVHIDTTVITGIFDLHAVSPLQGSGKFFL